MKKEFHGDWSHLPLPPRGSRRQKCPIKSRSRENTKYSWPITASPLGLKRFRFRVRGETASVSADLLTTAAKCDIYERDLDGRKCSEGREREDGRTDVEKWDRNGHIYAKKQKTHAPGIYSNYDTFTFLTNDCESIKIRKMFSLWLDPLTANFMSAECTANIT